MAPLVGHLHLASCHIPGPSASRTISRAVPRVWCAVLPLCVEWSCHWLTDTQRRAKTLADFKSMTKRFYLHLHRGKGKIFLRGGSSQFLSRSLYHRALQAMHDVWRYTNIFWGTYSGQKRHTDKWNGPKAGEARSPYTWHHLASNTIFSKATLPILSSLLYPPTFMAITDSWRPWPLPLTVPWSSCFLAQRYCDPCTKSTATSVKVISHRRQSMVGSRSDGLEPLIFSLPRSESLTYYSQSYLDGDLRW